MGRDGCPRALDLGGVDRRDHGRAVASTIRHGRGGAGGRMARGVAGAGAVLLRGGPDWVRALPGGGRGRDRLSGDRAVQDAAGLRGSAQVRSPRHGPVVAAADGRRVDGGRGPGGDVRGGPRSGQGARAGEARLDALPAAALEAVVAPRPGVGPQHVDQGAPRVAGIASLRASEHRAGVHRQSCCVRRAERAARGARLSGSRGSRPTPSSRRWCAGCARSAGSTPSRP